MRRRAASRPAAVIVVTAKVIAGNSRARPAAIGLTASISPTDAA
jgi:hypothetical protein